ncbi:hypothetical protein RRG08_046072 [Elysia crispata]|uniref:Uncharacterized protein n=1 Tax=Elysia crispata TaxID=231223 RepID=A0AAE0Y4T8_9GAST|nr:hypothetical protein RRG08_046072 [Elysia crispata]
MRHPREVGKTLRYNVLSPRVRPELFRGILRSGETRGERLAVIPPGSQSSEGLGRLFVAQSTNIRPSSHFASCSHTELVLLFRSQPWYSEDCSIRRGQDKPCLAGPLATCSIYWNTDNRVRFYSDFQSSDSRLMVIPGGSGSELTKLRFSQVSIRTKNALFA